MMLVPASREITASSDAQALRYSTAREKATPDARQLGQQAGQDHERFLTNPSW